MRVNETIQSKRTRPARNVFNKARYNREGCESENVLRVVNVKFSFTISCVVVCENVIL